MDLSFAAARTADPDLIIANDPDADRCAVAVKDGEDWRMLRGDEVGALLAAHLVARGARGVFAESIVSSSLLGRIAEKAGLPYEETLTGFKWIARVDGLRYGYEEALGYCVDPEGVRDKDGITAALLVTELASTLKEQGRTLLDALDDLAVAHGLHATDQLSVRVDDLAIITKAMAALREAPPLPNWQACGWRGRRTSPRARPRSRRRTACATRWTASTGPGSSSARAARSPSSSATWKR